jgi:hypothetical protein
VTCIQNLVSRHDEKEDIDMSMSSRTLQAIVRKVSTSPLAFPVVQKRFAATILQKPKIVDLSRELYHRCPNHPFHVPFVCPESQTSVTTQH